MTESYRTIIRWLTQQPAGLMFPMGLVAGAGLGAVALLGLGGWVGAVVGALVLGSMAPLVIGAQPVMRSIPTSRKQVTAPPDVDRQGHTTITVPTPVNDIPDLLDMIELPGGTFWMGSPEDDEQADEAEHPQHRVTVSALAMSRCPITRKLYREVQGDGPDNWRNDTNDDGLPANYVRWFDAVQFCNALSQRQGLQPCYRIAGSDVQWDRDADGYRLPTEAEWEYAARAGTTTRWFCGDTDEALPHYAWFDKNAGNRLHRVGEQAANPWGFHDMVGNVWEWCWDWFASYTVEAVTDPSGPTRGGGRVLRGGAFWRESRILRSAFRDRDEPVRRPRPQL